MPWKPSYKALCFLKGAHGQKMQLYLTIANRKLLNERIDHLDFTPLHGPSL